jgi:transcriptional regulator with XRE-family HTH domain
MPSLPQWNAWLLEQRSQRKLSQERFAELVGVSKRNIERWEKGMTPRLASRNLVEQALNEEGPGVSTDDALGEIRAALAHIAEVVGVTPAQMTAPAAEADDPQSKAALVLLAELSAEVERLTEAPRSRSIASRQARIRPSDRVKFWSATSAEEGSMRALSTWNDSTCPRCAQPDDESTSSVGRTLTSWVVVNAPSLAYPPIVSG